MVLLAGILGMGIIGIVLLLVISSLPLYFAVKFLGGKATILKVIFVNLFVGIVSGVLSIPLLGFILLLFIYKKFFELSWLKAFFALILQFVVAVILVVIAIVVLGIAFI